MTPWAWQRCAKCKAQFYGYSAQLCHAHRPKAPSSYATEALQRRGRPPKISRVHAAERHA